MDDLQLAYDVIYGNIMAYHRDGYLRPLNSMSDDEVMSVIYNITLDAKEQLGSTFNDEFIGQLVDKLFDNYCRVHNLYC